MSALQIKAIGENVILVSNPPKKGDEKYSKSGIFLGQEEQSLLPEYCTVYSVGESVPEGVIKVGDITAVPTGSMKHVPHPAVIEGQLSQNECRESFVTCHWKAIPAVYS